MDICVDKRSLGDFFRDSYCEEAAVFENVIFRHPHIDSFHRRRE